jgi:arabinose-5-phosphate isomerase
VLDVSVREEACPMNLTPTSSAAAAMALGDALAIAVLTRRGIGPDDVARLHPGGAIGRRLVRVAELMHRGDAMPLVADTASLEVVIHEMSLKRLGCTGVVDHSGRLEGIVTDGDLRRAIERGGGRLPSTVAELMTRGPKTVGRDELAVTALELMERHRITQLFIVDDEGRPDGILQHHDLLRAKIA